MPIGTVSMTNACSAAILGFSLGFLSSSAAQAQPASAADVTKTMRPVTDEMLLKPDPGDWLMWRRTYDGYGFSPLDQITKDNVKDLQVAWTWSLTNGATETTPIVHDGVLYIWNYADKVQALNAATGDLIWEYRARPAADADRPGRQQPGQAQHGDLPGQAGGRHVGRASGGARRQDRRGRLGP